MDFGDQMVVWGPFDKAFDATKADDLSRAEVAARLGVYASFAGMQARHPGVAGMCISSDHRAYESHRAMIPALRSTTEEPHAGLSRRHRNPFGKPREYPGSAPLAPPPRGAPD